MAVRLGDLVRRPELQLSVLAARHELDRQIRWVHSCELPDPTPYLQGGELLLSAGLWLQAPADGTAVDVPSYVDRLVRAGVVGLGFGVAPRHLHVPEQLILAADARGLPLIEVPPQTPFIAVSQAVSDALAAEQYAEVARSLKRQQELTRAAVAGGAAALVRRLAGLLDGWAVTLDLAGRVEHAAPAAAADRGPWLAPGLTRLRDISRPVSTSMWVDGEQVLVQSLRPGRRTRGYLAVGAATITGAQRELVQVAVPLLTLMLAPATALQAAESRLRTTIAGLLGDGDLERAARIAEDLWGGLPVEPVRILVADGTAAAGQGLMEFVEATATALGERVFFAEVADRLVVVYSAYGRLRDRVLAAITADGQLLTGESGSARLAELDRARTEADQALDAGLRLGRAHTAFSDIAGFGLIDLVATPPVAAFAESLIRPLLEHDASGRGDLVRSLQTWLEHNGQWDAAAAALGIHRHTLRHRMQRVEEVLGRDLDVAAVRVELWTGLQVLQLRRPAATPRVRRAAGGG